MYHRNMSGKLAKIKESCYVYAAIIICFHFDDISTVIRNKERKANCLSFYM